MCVVVLSAWDRQHRLLILSVILSYSIMQENYLIILVIAGLVDIFSCSVVGDNIPTVSVNSSCNVIKSSLFQLDLNCINNLGSENIRNISASTSKYCSSYYHCEYDAFYWDR